MRRPARNASWNSTRFIRPSLLVSSWLKILERGAPKVAWSITGCVGGAGEALTKWTAAAGWLANWSLGLAGGVKGGVPPVEKTIIGMGGVGGGVDSDRGAGGIDAGTMP